MKRKGFTLIEFMVYLTLFAVIVLAMASWISQLWPFYMKLTKQRVALINLHTAHDLFIRDIRTAPIDLKKWDILSDEKIIWNNKDNYISWEKRKDALIRIEGNYNSVKKQWGKKSQSLLVKPIDIVQFKVHGKEQIKRVSFIFKQEEIMVKNEISLCRKLPWKIEM